METIKNVKCTPYRNTVMCAVLSLFTIFLIFPANVSATEDRTGKIIFCNSINEELEPVDSTSTFATNLISWVAYSSQRYGALEVVFSVYQKEKDGKGQQMLLRVNMDVNPDWNLTAVREMPLPGPGLYTLALTRLDGTVLASGDVTISAGADEGVLPEHVESDGKSIEALFNRYKPAS